MQLTLSTEAEASRAESGLMAMQGCGTGTPGTSLSVGWYRQPCTASYAQMLPSAPVPQVHTRCGSTCTASAGQPAQSRNSNQRLLPLIIDTQFFITDDGDSAVMALIDNDLAGFQNLGCSKDLLMQIVHVFTRHGMSASRSIGMLYDQMQEQSVALLWSYSGECR